MDDEAADFFGEDDLFGDTEAIGADEAIEDNRYDGRGKDEISDFLKKEKKESKSRKTNPRALLNERSLIMGDAGISALKKAFANYKPNPKADPYSQLPELLKKYQHWAHVLAPRLKFEDVIARCEQLGEKRPIKVWMQKMRMGMPLTDEDFDEVTDTKRCKKSNEGLITTEYASDNENDRGRSRSSSPLRAKSISPPPKATVPKEAPRSMFGSSSSSTTVSSIPTSSAPSVPLTEEQRRRVAENRLKALALREKRLAEEREAAERERREEEERERMEREMEEGMEPDPEDVPEIENQEGPQVPEETLDEDEIMAQFDDFE